MPLKLKNKNIYIISETCTYHIELAPHFVRGLSSVRLIIGESHSPPAQATVVFSTDIRLCFWRIKLSMKKILRFKISYCHSGYNLITGISSFTHTVAGCAVSLFFLSLFSDAVWMQRTPEYAKLIVNDDKTHHKLCNIPDQIYRREYIKPLSKTRFLFGFS